MAALVISNPVWAELPDISTVKPDLAVPDLSEKPPGAGRRVKAVLPGYEGTGVYHLLYLPSDWLPGRRYPVAGGVCWQWSLSGSKPGGQ